MTKSGADETAGVRDVADVAGVDVAREVDEEDVDAESLSAAMRTSAGSLGENASLDAIELL